MNEIKTFIEKNFNNETIREQIQQQKKIINEAKKQIQRLQTVQERQVKKPWYHWEGIRFSYKIFDSYNDYRDRYFGQKYLKTYEDFVLNIIKERDSGNDIDFIIISPTGEEIALTEEMENELPLIKEYYEREKLKESLSKYKKKITYLEQKIAEIESDVKQTEKYTPYHISKLGEEKKQIEQEKMSLQDDIKETKDYQRIGELNRILYDIDKLMVTS